MTIIHPALLGLALLLSGADVPASAAADPSRLQQVLIDKQEPRNQSQAALLLVQNPSPEAEEIVRQGLRQASGEEVFLALAAAVCLTHDTRFGDELLTVLVSGKPSARQAAEAALVEVADANLLRRFRTLLDDPKTDWSARQAIVSVLGRNAQREAVVILLNQLSSDEQRLRQAAAVALSEATGQAYGLEIARWRSWWDLHKDASNERWLSERLACQASRAHRLQGELDQARAQIAHLHQQLFARLPAGDRLAQVQTLADSEDAALRMLAVSMCLEVLPTADAVGQRTVTDLLLRCSRDGASQVQRAAVLALGQCNDPRACDKLLELLQQRSAPMRGAAAHAVAQQAKGSGRDAVARQRQIISALQKALDDPALDVVVEAAESLGALGAPEAGPVLTVLLRHPSRSARQTAALALERVADQGILDGLLDAVDDPDATVRFSLVGALGHAAGDGHALSEPQRALLLARLEAIFLRDSDPGVRSRAATVLGDCGTLAVLQTLWRRVQANEDSRVQDKAWAAIMEMVVRLGNFDLLLQWDHVLVEAKQGPRQLQLLTEVATHWSKRDDTKKFVPAVEEVLIQAQLDQAKWMAAFPLVRGLLSGPGNDAETDKRLRWLLVVGQMALKDGNKQEAWHVVREARPYTTHRPALAAEFERLEKQAKP
ncbi:MAG TPA: HEAT repeat domain-containing protein [Gemmataceae bacterium]|jgi:HEAT repeat protein|nr:HEAT repeat domain-containing protein [Gemmataceae bacterium]